MRIGVPTTSYPRFVGDPAGSFVRALCMALVDAGHTCEVLAPDDPSVEGLTDRGVTVERVCARVRGLPPTFYAAGVPDNVRRDPRALLGLGLFVSSLVRAIAQRAGRWDAVLSHWAVPCAMATRLGFGAARHVAVWHSADVQLAARVLGGQAWRAMREAASEHVFVAEHLRARLGAEYDARAHVVPMGVALPQASWHRANDATRPLRALVLARLVPIKRVELAIRAAEEAGIELVVGGDGPERARLERLAQRASTRFVGAVGEEARARLFSECAVLLATSAHDPLGATEGYPVAPREALAHGLVVVATDDPVHRELARRCGEAVIVTGEGTLATVLRELSRAPERVSALRAVAPAGVATDSWPRVTRRIEALLTPHSSMRRAPGCAERPSVAASSAPLE
jgi:glycosyltransferase involved in cell wall biosynthesis